jgi:putative N6-adenine-specific DNA methylase
VTTHGTVTPLTRHAELFLPCAGGTEAWLAAEVQALTGAPGLVGKGGVFCEGDAQTAMRLNLHSRLAQRVLWPLAGGRYRDEQDLYAMARSVDWPALITPEQSLRVDVSAQRSPLRSLNFAALRIKDAVCDALRERTGARPSVDTRYPTLPLVLYLGPDEATLYADTSGEALFKRGWRDARGGSEGVKGEAPLKETLAAAMLAAAGWQGRPEDGPLLDPFCGAGTIAIEAAQMACGIAPGLGRRSFAFERQLAFAPHRVAWQQLRQAAQKAQHAPAVPVFAGDVSFRMTDFAQRNAQAAGVAHAITFKTADAAQRPAPAEHGVLMMNPPYGERIEAKGSGAREAFDPDGQGEGSAAAFFAALAAHWKRHYAGWRVHALSPQAKLPSWLRLKESARVPMWNGPIECRLFRFDLVAGSHRRPPGSGLAADLGAGSAPGTPGDDT